MSIGLFIYNIILSKTAIPESAIAAYATAHRIEHLFFIPIISIATSMITLVGMFYGAKRHDLIHTVLIHCIKYTLMISVLFGALFYFLSYKIFPIFINDTDVINIGISYFNIFSFAIPFVTLSMICSRTIQGLGKSYPMFIITCLRVILISCSLGWYFIEIKNMPIEYAWISILISCISAAIISSIWLIFELRKLKQIS
jgi:Na+-driven multidrug efflux pump